jgi:archaellum biogenesis ATPase FlaH
MTRAGERLMESLTGAGLPDGAVRAIHRTFMAHASALADAREEHENVREELNRLRTSSMRRRGRVNRITPETTDGQPLWRVWIDESVSLVLPPQAELPRLGETVEYIVGQDNEGIYFGGVGFDHVGLIHGRLRRVQRLPDGGVLVEATLRDTGHDSDITVAVASEELRGRLDELEPGAPLRVTEGRVRIAYPAPEVDEEEEQEHCRLFDELEPMPADEDSFVYPPETLRQFDEIIKALRLPERAARQGVPVPNLICLEGPTGVGKSTMLERYLGRELAGLGFRIVRINTEETTSFWYGQSEKLMRQALEAGGGGDTLIIFDEIDSVLPKRSAERTTTSDDVNSRVFSTFTNALAARPQPGEPRKVVAFTTNFKARLDRAILSRIKKMVTVPLPTRETAMAIATSYLNRVECDGDAATIAEQSVSAVDVPLVRVVFDGSDEEAAYTGAQVLTGRAIEQAVDAAALAAFMDDTGVGPFGLAQELKEQLRANLADMGPGELIVGLGFSAQDVRRVTDVHVAEERLGGFEPTDQELRLRFRLVS